MTEQQAAENPTPKDNPLAPAQAEMPFAIVYGQHLTEMPKDLYIPPEALEVILEAFEGPLDLLLYLIKKQNLNILEINVAEITRQYMSYIELMQSMELELAAEYMVMAAMLTEIKSRMLLPRQTADEEEDDPRAELIRRLQEYERYRQAAEDIDQLPRLGRDTFVASAREPDRNLQRPQPDVDMREVLLALADVLRRVEMYESHKIHFEPLSTRERMSRILDRLRDNTFVPFVTFFSLDEGKRGVVVTFLAMMELIKEGLIEIVQNESFGPIHLKGRGVNRE
ncbi:MAG: segregation and condensation protein A [bacterium]